MGFYRRAVVPRICNIAMQNRRLTPHREATLGRASGRVLEIGAGSGLNLPLYPAAVRELIALEPDPVLTRMARRRCSSCPGVTFVEASAELMPLDSHSVDTVVSTWTMCSIPGLSQALGEIRRVLKPGGQLLFVEHGRAPEAGIHQCQQRLDPLWCRLSGGCHLDRPIATLIEAAGFKVTRLEQAYIPGPRFLSFLYEGAARPA